MLMCNVMLTMLHYAYMWNCVPVCGGAAGAQVKIFAYSVV